MYTRRSIVLASRHKQRYGSLVAANSATSFDRLKSRRRTSAAHYNSRRFFVPAVFYGGCVWGVLALAGFLFDRSVNLRTAATQSFDSECGSSNIQKGATPMTTLSTSATPAVTLMINRTRSAAHRAMAAAALRSDSSLSVRLARYNSHMIKARAIAGGVL